MGVQAMMDTMFRVPERYQIAQMYFTPFEQCLFVSWLSREHKKEKTAQEAAKNGQGGG